MHWLAPPTTFLKKNTRGVRKLAEDLVCRPSYEWGRDCWVTSLIFLVRPGEMSARLPQQVYGDKIMSRFRWGRRQHPRQPPSLNLLYYSKTREHKAVSSPCGSPSVSDGVFPSRTRNFRLVRCSVHVAWGTFNKNHENEKTHKGYREMELQLYTSSTVT